jgi:hypothetical protein
MSLRALRVRVRADLSGIDLLPAPNRVKLVFDSIQS